LSEEGRRKTRKKEVKTDGGNIERENKNRKRKDRHHWMEVIRHLKSPTSFQFTGTAPLYPLDRRIGSAERSE
jgi:ATP-dependent Zn protease